MITSIESLEKLIGKQSEHAVYGLEGGIALHGGKGGGSAPPAPDPKETASAQAAANKESAIATAELNMVNQNTPYGSLSYTPRGKSAGYTNSDGDYVDGVQQYTANQTLAPAQQRMLDLTNQAGIKYGETANNQLNAVSNKLSSPLDFGQLGPAPQANETTRKQVADSMYNRMSPLMNRDRERLETRLANQGITLNSDPYKDAMDEERRARNDAYLAIDNAALGQMGQLYGLESTARDKAVNEMTTERSQPLNELAAMLNGSAVQGPQFVNAPQGNINAADIMGAAYASYNGQMDAWKQKQANNNAMTSGLFTLAGGLGGGFLAGRK